MRNRFADTFFALAHDMPELVAIVADISPAGSIQKFREKYPNRFINTGVAEQVMIGMAAGMAIKGLRPFCYTIATFALYRPFEFIRDDLCYQNLPVTIVGIGGGLTYSTLGATHHAFEDIAIATALPGMTVIAPCEPDEVALATRYCAQDAQGPVYLRLGKAGEPNITPRDDILFFQVGKLRFIRGGEDNDTCIISYGAIMKLAAEVADALQDHGPAPALVSCHTLKPLDRLGIAQILSNYRRVVVIEETPTDHGLGAIVRQIAWDSSAHCLIETFGLRDEFTHVYGSHQDLLDHHGLSLKNIVGVLTT